MKKYKFLLLIASTSLLVACGNTTQTDTQSTAEQSVETSQEEISSEETEESETVDEPIVEENTYAEDDIVNQFMEDYVTTSNKEITDIEKGNIRTKYYAYFDGIYTEVINATDDTANYTSISYGFSDKSEDEIYALLTDFLTTLGASEEEISQTIADFTTNNEGDYMNEDYEVNSQITCLYAPTKELSKGTSIGHIEIHTTKYNSN